MRFARRIGGGNLLGLACISESCCGLATGEIEIGGIVERRDRLGIEGQCLVQILLCDIAAAKPIIGDSKTVERRNKAGVPNEFRLKGTDRQTEISGPKILFALLISGE